MPGSVWNRLLGLQVTPSGTTGPVGNGVVAPVAVEAAEAIGEGAGAAEPPVAGVCEGASSVPSMELSPFLSRTLNSWLAEVWLLLLPNLATNSWRSIRPFPLVSMLANNGGSAAGADAGALVVEVVLV